MTLEMRGICKSFGSNDVLKHVDFSIQGGEICALLGENGAGKSTLMNILGGVLPADRGEIVIDGAAVHFRTPSDSLSAGVAFIHQELSLINDLAIYENMFIGRELKTKYGLLDAKAMIRKTQEVFDRLELNLDPRTMVRELDASYKQIVEISRAMMMEASLIIMDEPTTSLTDPEIERVFDMMRMLQKQNVAIVFISHKLNEIMAVADRCTVLRKGKYIGTVDTKDTDKQSLSNMMVGRPVQLQVVKEPAQPKDPVLRVRHMCVASHQHKRDAVHDVSLEVRAGEIVCIAGIDGNGQTEFVQGLTGLDKITGGTVELCGKNITHTSIRRRGENMSHIPEDRHKHGLILDFTLEQNMVLQRYLEPRFQKAGFIKNAAVREYAQHLIDQYDVRSGQGPVTIARSMSGGNQQKAIIAREVDRDKSLIVAVQPTRGLDVGAIEYIHSQLVAERDRGKAVLLVSLELDEVMSLSDRILVMYEGQLVGQLNPKTTTVAELGLYMSGAKRDDMGGDQA